LVPGKVVPHFWEDFLEWYTQKKAPELIQGFLKML